MKLKVFLAALLIAFGSLEAMSKAPVTSTEQVGKTEKIGVRTFKFKDESRERPVVVELWYPTTAMGPLVELADAWVHPKEIRDVQLSDKKEKYSLILMSHGHCNDRRSQSWLAAHLVSQGFIVASVEHYGNSMPTYNPAVSLRFWERPRDISFAIDQLLKEPSLQDRIDSNRIGFVGYSMGGMTGLALAGAKAQDVKEVVKQQNAKYKEVHPEVVEAIDFSEGHGNFADPRIKAFVLLCPATFVYSPQSLQSVKTPIAVVASIHDEVLPHKDHGLKIIKNLSASKLKLLRGTSHYACLNCLTEAGKKSLRKELDIDRTAVHREVGAFTIDFFKEVFQDN